MSSFPIHKTWIELSSSALNHNIKQYKQWLNSQTQIAAVIKANAYGHGLIEIGLLHENNPDIVRLCVANSNEGILLREAGVTKPILVLGFINNPIDLVVKNNLEIIFSDIETLCELNNAAKNQNKKALVHLKIDTGLSRLGFLPKDVAYVMQKIKSLSNIELIAVCSHLIEASNPATVHAQEEILQSFRIAGVATHTTNSHGSLHSKYHYDYVRIGAGLYGYLPEADPALQALLKPVLSLKTTVIGIKQIDTGTSVGYGKTFYADKPTKLAFLAMGYYEGMNPDLANLGKVIIAGKIAPIVGRINMNYFTVNITDIADVKIHDTATIIGTDGQSTISAYDWRTQARKNVRIFLAQLNPLIPKKIID